MAQELVSKGFEYRVKGTQSFVFSSRVLGGRNLGPRQDCVLDSCH